MGARYMGSHLPLGQDRDSQEDHDLCERLALEYLSVLKDELLGRQQIENIERQETHRTAAAALT